MTHRYQEASETADSNDVSEERSQFAQRINEHQFTMSRRGYDKQEVKSYLEDLEQAFRELEGHARRTAQRVGDLERDLSKARATEKVSVDNAMMAVFDAKDRILERARRRADEIEEDAQTQAVRIRETAIADVTGTDGAAAGEIAAARAQADEIVASARREADRLRQDAGSESSEDLEAELTGLTAQLRRAHDDTASAREDLDAARNRIVELENVAENGRADELEQRFAELEGHVGAARAEAEKLQTELDAEREQAEELRNTMAAVEGERDQTVARLSDLESELTAERVLAEEARGEAAATDQLRSELETARSEIQELQTAAAATAVDASRIEELNAQLQQNQTELTGYRDTAAEAETSRGSLVQELADAKSQVEAAEASRESLVEELVDAKSQVEAAGTESQGRLEELEQLRSVAADTQHSSEAAEQITAQLEAQRRHTELAEFVGRMKGTQERLAADSQHHDLVALVAELKRGSQLAAVAHTPEVDLSQTTSEADEILAAARLEAEAIKQEVEEEAEQRAAKVIGKAREEADQVRQTVATLTAQADDARSVALRSKLEAEDLAQAQRAMSDARDDIVATAERQASEVQGDAEKEAAAMRAEAEELVTEAREEAERITTESEESARVRLADAEEKAAQLVSEVEQAAAEAAEQAAKEAAAQAAEEAAAQAAEEAAAEAAEEAAVSQPIEQHSGDELAAMLAEAEREVAMSEELRRQRRELEELEAELDEGRFVAAQQSEAAMPRASMRDTPAEGSEVVKDDAPSPPPEIDVSAVVELDESESADIDFDSDDDEDPADRLSALLEQVAPSSGGVDDATPVDLDDLDLGELGLDEAAEGDGPEPPATDGEQRPRFAWPTAIEDDTDDDENSIRESRYRSRSAQLPRLGKQAESNMATMANLRKKSRGSND